MSGHTAENDVSLSIKAQNPNLETAWRTIAWWEQTCDYWYAEAQKGYALRDSLATRVIPPDKGEPSCCDLHNRNCEPPSELCCRECTEAAHPDHRDGSACIAPDLSGYAQVPLPTRCSGPHWFTYYGWVGSSAPSCQRCGVANPRYDRVRDPLAEVDKGEP